MLLRRQFQRSSPVTIDTRNSISSESSGDMDSSEKRLSTASSDALAFHNGDDERSTGGFSEVCNRPDTGASRSHKIHEDARRRVNVYRRNMHAYMQWQLQRGTLPGYQRIMHSHTLSQFQAWQVSRSPGSVAGSLDASTVCSVLSRTDHAKAVGNESTGDELAETGHQEAPH